MKGVEHRTGPCASGSVVVPLSDHGLRKAAHLSVSQFSYAHNGGDYSTSYHILLFGGWSQGT